MSMVPKSGKAELHLTLNCTLSCVNCNRASFLRDPHTPDMAVEDVVEFLRQCRDLYWYPAIILIGGEPTMHPDFYEICRLSREFANEGADKNLGYPEMGLQGLVQLWSNRFTKDAREKCEVVEREYSVSVVYETTKERSLVLSVDDIFVSPADMGLGLRPHCWQHSSEICGISVDGGGYSLCATGGMVDGVLDLGARTKVLANLFDEGWAAEHTAKLCEHCGNCLSSIGIPDVVTQEEWREMVESSEKWRGMYVSPTWKKAYEGRK